MQNAKQEKNKSLYLVSCRITLQGRKKKKKKLSSSHLRPISFLVKKKNKEKKNDDDIFLLSPWKDQKKNKSYRYIITFLI